MLTTKRRQQPQHVHFNWKSTCFSPLKKSSCLFDHLFTKKIKTKIHVKFLTQGRLQRGRTPWLLSSRDVPLVPIQRVPLRRCQRKWKESFSSTENPPHPALTYPAQHLSPSRNKGLIAGLKGNQWIFISPLFWPYFWKGTLGRYGHKPCLCN